MDGSLLSQLWDHVSGGTLLGRLLESLVLVLVVALILALAKRVIVKICELSGVDRRTAEDTYRLVELSVAAITVFLVLYMLTEQQVIAYLVLSLVIVVVAASWEAIANVAGYYALILSKPVKLGEYVTVAGCEGKVKRITLLYTLVEEKDTSCSIPNRLFLSTAKTSVKEPVYARVKVRVWGFEGVDVAEGIVSKLEESLPGIVGGVTAAAGEARIHVEELGYGSVTAIITVPIAGYRVQPERMDEVVRGLAAMLKEHGYPFNVGLETQDGGPARCKMHA